MNFIGAQSTEASLLSETGRWFEPIPSAQLQPQNLYEAQLNRRIGR